MTAKVKINLTAPGIFTADGSGTGQAAALNYNSTTGAYTLNSTTAPAKIGDTVILYLTGEGNYNAALLTGAILTNTGFIIPATLSPLPQMSPLPDRHDRWCGCQRRRNVRRPYGRSHAWYAADQRDRANWQRDGSGGAHFSHHRRRFHASEPTQRYAVDSSLVDEPRVD